MSRDIKPRYSKREVARAGEQVRDGVGDARDIAIIENWRASHNHVLNSWQATLRNRCKGKDIVFAQRLKRRSTIFDKLLRQPTMRLSRMQDIAGCRLIFRSIEELHEYRRGIHTARMKHIRKKADIDPYPYDYISSPADSGYRGIHDVYEYVARKGRSNEWDGHLVEVQYRTIYQHAWATAVEVAGSLTGNHSKFDRGDESHKEFFRLASEVISRTTENMSSCFPEISNAELVDRFDSLEEEIHLLRTLEGIRIAREMDSFHGNNNILVFFEEDGVPTIDVYSYDGLPQATKRYFELEKKYATYDVVLVRSDSEHSIRSAFRNYFSDAKDFVRLMRSGLRDLRK